MTLPQIRGALLEEAILHLLRVSGYSTIELAGVDPTLHDGHSGLEVRGRGSMHQIDAIADFVVAQPFSYRQRLLVEAKCYSDNYPVELAIVRNAVGVLKDVSEYWVPPSHASAIQKSRYHYQYALFSASGYTSGAQEYAFAQDIYLIPLRHSKFIRPIVKAIRRVTSSKLGVPPRSNIDLDMKGFRRAIREEIRTGNGLELGGIFNERLISILRAFCLKCRAMQGAILAMISRSFPTFLIPAEGVRASELADYSDVRIRWDEHSWYLMTPNTENKLFSFDLPPELFSMYAEHGVLEESQALNLKEQFLSDIQAIITENGRPRVISFQLEPGWIAGVRETLNRISRERKVREE